MAYRFSRTPLILVLVNPLPYYQKLEKDYRLQYTVHTITYSPIQGEINKYTVIKLCKSSSSKHIRPNISLRAKLLKFVHSYNGSVSTLKDRMKTHSGPHSGRVQAYFHYSSSTVVRNWKLNNLHSTNTHFPVSSLLQSLTNRIYMQRIMKSLNCQTCM